MVFKKVETEFWQPIEPGTEIVGVLIKVQDEVGKNKSKVYHLEVNQKPVNVWGATVLDSLMTSVKEGDLIKIVYNGFDEKSKAKLYELYKDE